MAEQAWDRATSELHPACGSDWKKGAHASSVPWPASCRAQSQDARSRPYHRHCPCAGCIRQVYLGVGANLVNSAPAIGPSCVYSGGVGTVAPGVATNPWSIFAPALPGIYYVRAASTLDFSCVQGTALGPPDLSIGRIVVQAASTTSIVLSLGGVPVTFIDEGARVTVTACISSTTI